MLIICVSFLFLINQIEAQSNELDPMLDVSPTCKYHINKTDPPFVIETPNFGIQNYQTSIKCAWLIESSTDLADIAIEIDQFYLEPEKKCTTADYMKLFKKNEGDILWTVVGNDEGYCGPKKKPQKFVQNTKRMLLIFYSNRQNVFPGFNGSVSITVTQTAPIISCLGKMKTNGKENACNRTVHTEEQERIFVSCRAPLALPPPTYKWIKLEGNGTAVEIDERIVKSTSKNGDIQLYNLEMSDSGFYNCTAMNRMGNDSQTFELKVAEKCTCPKIIHLSWYSYPPYIYYGTHKNGSVKMMGIFKVILTKMIREVCGTCDKGHGETELVWDNEEKKNSKKGFGDLKNDVEELDESKDHYDLIFPMSAGKSVDTYRGKYCIPVVDSPGTALIVTKEPEGASAQAMFKSILGGWPILVLVVVMATLAGVIMWILDTYWNEEQFPRNFTDGMGEGFWWAFVTMTTVGYGDIAPVGVPGRLFAVIWILTGLIIVAIFTGVITTSLTVVAMSTNVKLYGAKIGAINNTAEFRMGVVRNADIRNFSNFDTLKAAMTDRVVDGMLLDAFVAAHYGQQVKGFRVNNIIETNSVYCAVLANDLNKKAIYDKFIEYLQKKKSEITSDIEENTETLDEPGSSAAQEAAADLFSPSNSLFLSSLWGTCSMLVVFTILGLLFEYVYLRPRHRMIEAAKNLEMVESIEVKEMAYRAKMLKECLLNEVSDFYDRWAERLGSLTEKHKKQQQLLLTKGPCKTNNVELASPNLANQSKGTLGSSGSGNSRTALTKDETKGL